MNDQKKREALKDREDYRANLIRKNEETEAKIAAVESQIKKLKEN